MAKAASIAPGHIGPIVLVDDEIELVRAVGGMLVAEFGETLVRATSSPAQAREWMQKEQPGVLITDVRMPGTSGIELISEVQTTWGATPTVVITAFPTAEVTLGARRGTFTYLPKPFTFASLLEAIRPLLAAPSAFRGAVAVSTLADILQLYAISGATGMMAVFSIERRGEIWFERGQITHACTIDLEGFAAFCAVLGWPKGSFSWHRQRSEHHTIDMSVSTLMLEAYRIHDESRRDARDTVPPPRTMPDSAFNLEGMISLDRPNTARPSPPSEAAPHLPDMLEPMAVTVAAESESMGSMAQVLANLGELDGFLGVALVDSELDTPVGVRGTGIDVCTASASNTELLQLTRRTVKSLNLHDEVEEILVTLSVYYHFIRPLRGRPGVFFYLSLDRERASLALARRQLAGAEGELDLSEIAGG